MLSKLLNTNQPSVLFMLPFFTAFLWIPFFLFPVEPDSHIVTSYVVIFKTDLLMTGITGTILAFCLTTINAMFLNRIINNSELCNKPSFIYAFIFVLLESILRTNCGFYTWQLSQFFLLASLCPLLAIYNQRNVIHLGSEAGLLIAIATIFYQPSVLFVLIILVFIQVFRPFNWREWLFPFLGFCLIILFLATYHYLKKEPFFVYFLFEKFNYTAFYNSTKFSIFLLGLLILLGIGTYLQSARRTIMHARKQRLVILFMFLSTTVGLGLLNYFELTYANFYLVLFIAPLFVGYYFADCKLKWLGELILIGSIIFQLSIRYLSAHYF